MFQRILKMDWKNILFAALALFALAVVFAAILTFAPKRESQVPDLTASSEEDLPEFEAEPGAPATLCRNALAQAKAKKHVPEAAALTDPDPRQSDWERRYICDAAASETNYAITLDHVCAKNGDRACVRLITISRDDGEVTYQRPQ